MTSPEITDDAVEARRIVSNILSDFDKAKIGYDAVEEIVSALTAALAAGRAEAGAAGWQTMDTAPKDGTRILAKLHREAIADMDGIRRKAFTEIREIWYREWRDPIFGGNMPWHAGDPFDSHDGMAPDHMGEGVPIAWMPLPGSALVSSPAAEAEPAPVAWPSGFFAIGGDARLRDCATEGCGQHVSIRVERGGVGSDHCEPCARKIAAALAQSDAAGGE